MAGGALLLVAACVAGLVLLSPSPVSVPVAPIASPTVVPDPGRPAAALPADRVATVLVVDPGSGAGGVARSGDRVDVLGYFPQKVTGTQSETRLLLKDVQVLMAIRSNASVALTLAVPHDAALLLQEAQAIGARPLVTLRAVQSSPIADSGPTSFSDSDLAVRLAGGLS